MFRHAHALLRSTFAAQEPAHVVQIDRAKWMIFSQLPTIDCQSLPVQAFGFLVLTLPVEQKCQIIDHGRDLVVLAPKRLAADP